MKTSSPSIFTPNTQRGGAERYVLYRHGPTKFSVTPNGQRFSGTVEPDACGAGCYCGAFLIPDKSGALVLLNAKIIDSQSREVKP